MQVEVKCLITVHTAGVTSSKLVPPTKKNRFKLLNKKSNYSCDGLFTISRVTHILLFSI
ncbi:hypothetical protein MCEGE14_01233 [Burkholderiaceae bacterium]